MDKLIVGIHCVKFGEHVNVQAEIEKIKNYKNKKIPFGIFYNLEIHRSTETMFDAQCHCIVLLHKKGNDGGVRMRKRGGESSRDNEIPNSVAFESLL